jgi:hypothetical protein
MDDRRSNVPHGPLYRIPPARAGDRTLARPPEGAKGPVGNALEVAMQLRPTTSYLACPFR